MSDTRNAAQLLVVALQDLHDAERAWIERLPGFADKASGGLSGFISEERVRAARQAVRLEALAGRLDVPAAGAPNIWLRAILDDADRDASTIAAGPLRNVALIGAFRKGKQAERVSYETAVGLAERIGDHDAAQAFGECRHEEQAGDDGLADLLAAELQSIS
jgi:ferritin-like metal-binding protein YciE